MLEQGVLVFILPPTPCLCVCVSACVSACVLSVWVCVSLYVGVGGCLYAHAVQGRSREGQAQGRSFKMECLLFSLHGTNSSFRQTQIHCSHSFIHSFNKIQSVSSMDLASPPPSAPATGPCLFSEYQKLGEGPHLSNTNLSLDSRLWAPSIPMTTHEQADGTPVFQVKNEKTWQDFTSPSSHSW